MSFRKLPGQLEMDERLKAFLNGRSPSVEERQDWLGGDIELRQTRATYALAEADFPPADLVTSVRALLTRGSRIMVVRDPDGEHILPGGRVDEGEAPREALVRELLEETGWSVRGEPVLMGMFHFHIHSPRPADYSYPYPDFLHLLYRAEADSHFPEAMEVGGYELGAEFRPRMEVQRLPLSLGEAALLKFVTEN